MKAYKEDKSIQGRKEEIAIKVKRLQEGMEKAGQIGRAHV